MKSEVELNAQILQRLIRVESRLTVLLRAIGLDNHGKPLPGQDSQDPKYPVRPLGD
jgi:hypothetical protein